MRLNFPNYVEQINFPPSRALDALFEAISNSIDAIDEREESVTGKIAIEIERIPQEILLDKTDQNREY